MGLDLLRAGEAASYLTISRRSFERLVADGEVPLVRLAHGGRRFLRADLDDLLTRSRVTTKTPEPGSNRARARRTAGDGGRQQPA